jgi:hypothetical protein
MYILILAFLGNNIFLCITKVVIASLLQLQLFPMIILAIGVDDLSSLAK